MATVEFIYKQVSTNVQCNENDIMLDICTKFAAKAGKKIKNLYFLYNGGPVNLKSKFSEQASNIDKENKKMKILAQGLVDTVITPKKLTKAKDIICPECGDVCLFHLHDYKLSLFGCREGHHNENISFEEFDQTQNIDETNIVCQNCSSVDKESSFENKFFVCINCNMNLCPICKTKHATDHVIIDYDQSNFICLKHNGIFDSYCDKCKVNCCLNCEKDHYDHLDNIIYFRDIFPKNEILNKQLTELRDKIDSMNFKMSTIIEMFHDVMNEMELFYNFNNKLIQRYNQNINRNYQLLNNINDLISFNSKFLGEMSIFKTDNYINILKTCADIFSKTNKPKESDYSPNDITCLYQMKKGQRRVQIFGHEFIKNNKYNFDLFLNKQKYDLRDEFNFPEPKERDEILEIRIVSKSMITSMKSMFFNCSSLISINPNSKWNTSHVMDMSFMFCGCKNLAELPDFSKWDTSNLCDMSYMFRECEKVEKIKNLNNFDVSKVTSISNLFYGCSNLVDIGDISQWNINKLIDMSHLFYDCIKLKTVPDISDWKINNLSDMSFVFNNCNNLISLPKLEKWDTKTVNDIKNFFYNCSSLQALPDISKWNINNVFSLRCLFYNCKSLKSLPDISKWNTDNVIDMSYMFYGCMGLGSLPDISLWRTGNVENMSCMFNSLKSLGKLPDISIWNTSKVKLMNYMFFDCVYLQSIPDIFKWKMGNVESVARMFYGCAGLNALPDINKWNINNVKEKYEIFKGCSTKLNIPPKYLG